jgi:integrase
MRPDSPYRRTYATGKERWVARYTHPITGKRLLAKPAWNRGRSTFDLKRDAQRAITEAIDKALLPEERTDSLGNYFKTWTARHPRAERTNQTNEHRISRVLGMELEGRPLRDWPLTELRRRHGKDVLNFLLVEQKRSGTGARAILAALSALAEDAIEDDFCLVNPFKGIKIRASDPRIKKQNVEKRVWSIDQMHEFARAAGPCEPLVRVLSDCGLRLGEALALRRADFTQTPEGGVLSVVQTVWEGRVLAGTKTDHGQPEAGRTVPVPPSTAALIRAMPPRIDSLFLFPSPRGKVWRSRNFYRDVWYPARDACGMDIHPHEMRHSWVTHLRAAPGINDADLAARAGHNVETMLGVYLHPLNESDDAIRAVFG